MKIEPNGENRPRVPGFVYGAILLALMVVLSFIALTARQPPPPAIAEFAPQAVQQIKQAEANQTFGAGLGSSAAPQPPPPPAETSESREAIEVARVRKCIGNPPRQIEDPQSPPCVAYWKGDSGGSTARGVTKDEIRLFAPTGEVTVDLYPALEKFFNSRFEFYGRKIKIEYGRQYPNAGSAMPADQRASAIEADEEKKVFASLRYRTTQGYFYHEELARRKMLSVTGMEYGFETSYLQERAPYIWQYMPETDEIAASLGEWGCKRLAGKTARYGGAPVQPVRRSFGIILQTYYDEDSTGYEPLVAELGKCGEKPKVLRNPIRTGANADTQYQARDPVTASNAMLDMSNAGVTSIFCLCHYYAFGAFTKAASNQSYYPEWLISSWGELDTIRGIVYLANATPEQMAHAFGLSFRPPQIKAEEEPHRWAAAEANSAYANETVSSVTVANRNFQYRGMLLMASGIQMAGPNLTYETFERALQRTVFPNPEHRNHPGKVDFRPDRYAMEVDGTEFWWSNTSLHPYSDQGTGTPCYVNRKLRYTKGKWPSGEVPFFEPPCDSGI